jgi:hypothetical protein
LVLSLKQKIKGQMKKLTIIFAVLLLLFTATGWAKFAYINANLAQLVQLSCVYPIYTSSNDDDVSAAEAGSRVSGASQGIARSGIKTQTQGGANAQKNSGNGNDPTATGDFSTDNLRLDAAFNYTEFNDTSINVQGDVEDYNLTLSGSISESLSFTVGYNHNRLDTNEGPELVIESEGINGSLHYNLTDNYGIGAFASYSFVDYEGINGNSFAYSTGVYFSTYHEFDFLNLSTATSVAYTDFDLDHDTIFTSLVNVSKQVTDYLNLFTYISYTDSLRDSSHNLADSSYFNVGAGFDVFINESLTFSFTYDTTESLHNYNDQSFFMNVGYKF